MSDNDSDNEDHGGINLTGFLFGNVDEKGELENDFLDDEAKKHLSSLHRFGIGSILSGVINEEDQREEDSDANSSSSADERNNKHDDNPDRFDDTDFSKKEDSAVDYSDINELADESPPGSERQVTNESEKDGNKETDFEMDLEDAIPANKLVGDRLNNAETTNRNVEKSSEDGATTDDKELMPPPPPLRLHIPSQQELAEREINGPSTGERKLDTPLAAMLPSKYANTDVRELFPDFSQDKVLRFSRLFGPGKISSLPQIWRSVRRRRRKKMAKEREMKFKDGSDSQSDTDEPQRSRGFALNFAPLPPKDMWASDDEEKLLSAVTDVDKEEKKEASGSSDSKPAVADWRFGPAQIWYDMLDVSETGEGFNYGFKLKQEDEEQNEENENPIPDDAYLMVSQLHWEDDVVWDGNEIKHKVMQKLNSKTNAAGWLPSSGSRTAGAFSQPGKSMPPTTAIPGTKNLPTTSGKKSQHLAKNQNEDHDDTWYSIFPVENEELVYSKWEDEVIWDAEKMSKIPKPKVLTLDPNDENIILGIPDDIDPSTIRQNTGPQPKVKIPHPHVKKSKILLGKAGVINVLAEDTPPPPPKSPDRDPFNISNDVYYQAKSSEAVLRLKVGGANLIQHSTPVVELRAPFIPTHMGPMKLRAFHRPGMKKFSHGALASTAPQPVLPLVKHIKKKAAQRNAERIASGGGDVFFMRTPDDLTGRDGEIILVEFCEEHPPLMNQVGMCSKIKTYYKRKAAKDSAPQDFKYGEVAIAHTSPFLGILHPGQWMQVVENNMYRAPIYPHNVHPTDFLVIRTRQNYFIREIDALFVAGQECPLYEVPGPNSKRANNFTRDFLQVFIYRLFWKSKDNPRKIRMDDIKRAFPAHSESSIRKRLKQCADFKRTGMDSNFWVIKPEFRLPSEEEIRAMVSPEQCCAYFSMIAAEQRLKDAGYGEKFIFAQEDDDEESQLKLDDEVKVAPWNTTRAYIQAVKGKCILQLTGPADPTGIGEGFSYVRMPNKPTQNKEEQESQPKRTVTGTDADLRRLSLNNAKALLRKFQVPEEEIKKLSRWEVIDVVRTLSTEKAKAGEEGMDKFSRGNRFSIAEHQERYKEECQRIFDLQNKVLASAEVLSTDEGESTVSEESDLEELGKNLENMLANKKTSTQLSLEREEQERQELLRKIMEERENSGKPKSKKDEDQSASQQSPTSRILKITRVFKDNDGKEYTRAETVRRGPVIDAYVKIRTTKDDAFIKQFATLDEAQKEEMKREKRRIQEQLRRIKRNQEKIGMQQTKEPNLSLGTPLTLGEKKSSFLGKSTSPTSSHFLGKGDLHSSKKKIKLKPDLKLKCGACGQVGHMRTNKACPQYTGTIPTPSVNVAITEEEEEQIERQLNDEDENLVNVDGTKVKLSGKLLKRQEEIKRRTLLLKVPKDAVGRKKRRMGSGDCDYLQRNKTANRRRTDPVVVLSSILEQILNDIRDMPDVQPFLFPVKEKQVQDYYRIILRPMDLQTIRDNLRHKKYQSREEFLADVNQIVENTNLYNGPGHTITFAAKRMLQRCVDRLAEREERLIRLEKAINPLLDDNDQVALSFIFEKIINGKLKTMQESWSFLKPVDRKKVKDYYNVIRRPMDLETISKKIKAQKYHSRQEFLGDIELIVQNCEQYNGLEHTLTTQARSLLNEAYQSVNELSEHISQLEANIVLAQERARNEADEAGWADYEHDGEGDSPENSQMEGDGFERPLSQQGFNKSMLIAPMPEVKRSRGRPRKQPMPGSSEDLNAMPMIKRGRGRPRKDSMNPGGGGNLEEDLQFSTDDEEEFEEVDNVIDSLVQGESANNTQMSGHMMGTGEDDSQQAAEAMVQLSGIGFYTQPQGGDDSIDIDPNYDPSDFLSMNNRNLGQSQSNTFLAPAAPPPSTSRDFDAPAAPIEYKFDPTNMQFTPMHEPAYPVMDFNQKPSVPHSYEQMAAAIQEQMQFEANEQHSYQEQHHQQQQHEEHMPVYQFASNTQQQQQQHYTQQVITKQEPQDHHDGNEMEMQQEPPLHDDLAISDSDDEQSGLRMQQDQQNNEDEGGLWF